ncbi:hypothetical protein GIB67_026490 [Kingdonia uniflora]|uniref:Uncharacterized protein n=1 Tax=Kingdonia uniflora TaxID=39325 RepID=A0A7J7P6U6_9MAGN|nr:hypothetical protein GIB67_026490 [Kingdonia uniflora]
MSSIASFLVFMSGDDGSSMRAILEPLTTQRKEYRPRGLQAPKETFDLDPGEHQVMLDYKVSMALQNLKSRLRTNNYDAYETNEERKSKRLKGIKKEDWIEFVDHL